MLLKKEKEKINGLWLERHSVSHMSLCLPSIGQVFCELLVSFNSHIHFGNWNK